MPEPKDKVKKLKDKAKKRTLTPQERYEYYRSGGKFPTDMDSIGPKEQTFKLDPKIKRGGTAGVTIGQAPKKRLKKSGGIKSGGRRVGRGR